MEADFRKEMEARLDATDARVSLRLNEAAMAQQQFFLEMSRKMDAFHAELVTFHSEMIVQIARLDSKIDRVDSKVERFDSKIGRAIASIVQWMVGLQIATAAILIAVILHLD